MLLLKALCFFRFISVISATQISRDLGPQSFSDSFVSGLYEICPGVINTYNSSGTLTSPNWDSFYYGYTDCYFYIYFPVGINIQINVNDLYTATKYSYLQILTSNTTSYSPYTTVATLYGQYGTVNYTYNLKNNARIEFFVYNSLYGRFRLTWKAMPEYPLSPTLSKSDCQGPDVLFLLDRSQVIFPGFYNTNITNFVRKMASQYSFLDDITAQNPFSSRFGIIEFSDNATVSVPLGKYSRTEFYWRIHNNTGYGSGGVSNVTAALSLAYTEFSQHGSPNNGSYSIPKVIILVVNDVSSFDLKPALIAMNKLKELIQLPMGIIVPGLPGTIPGSQKRLSELMGNANWTFDSLDSAVTGIPALTNSTFKCTFCTDLIFICEMTVAIGYDTKLECLQLAQKLAVAANKNSKRKYAIALYGPQIYNSIILQDFSDFNATINKMIENLEQNNLPNGGQTYLAPVLNQLYAILGNSSSSKIGVTLIMGELSVIKDPSPAHVAAQKIAKLNSDIYVLDETRFGPPKDLWTTLTRNQPNHIVNGTLENDVDDLFKTFMQDLEKSQC